MVDLVLGAKWDPSAYPYYQSRTVETRVMREEGQMSGVPTCSSPLSVSGGFIQSAKDGQLEALVAETVDYCRLLAQKAKLDRKLLDCNNPIWLAAFACQTGVGGFEVRLRTRVQDLLEKRDVVVRELEASRNRLERESPGVPSVVQASFDDRVTAIPTPTKKPRPTHNAKTAERNRIIKRFQDLPHLQICYKLDEARNPGVDCSRLLPNRWRTEFGVKTFVSAYHLEECRPRVQRVISGGKKR
jgi:hypothetical protein